MTATALSDARAAGPALEVARGLADPLRWRIVELLAGEQLCVAHLTEELGVGQPLVSHHLKALRTAGLVSTDRYRYWTYYRLHLTRSGCWPAIWTAWPAPRPMGQPAAGPSMLRPRPPLSVPPHPEEAGPCPSATPPWTRSPVQTFARSIESLAEEFRGIFSLETIERYVDESVDRLSGARVVDFIPLFVHRFSREQPRPGPIRRSHHQRGARGPVRLCPQRRPFPDGGRPARPPRQGPGPCPLGRQRPGDKINPAVMAMDEWGIDLSQEFPKP